MLPRWWIVVVLAVLPAIRVAHADPLPDASLAALADRTIEVELDDGRSAKGHLLAFDATTITVVAIGSGEVMGLERAHVRHVRLVETVADEPRAPAPPPWRRRAWGVELSLPGMLTVDVDRGYFHAFGGASFLLPLLTAAGEHSWYAFSGGAGASYPVTERWKLDAFGALIPIRYTSFYTYVAMGVGVGAHFTGRSGVTFGVTVPLVGFAARVGHSPYGYDAPFRYNDSLGYFYFAGLTALPLVTVGYRFAAD